MPFIRPMLLLAMLCAPLTVGLAETPQEEPREFLDLPYYLDKDADPQKHRLDLYLPQGVEKAPVLLWIHGGAWVTGDRAKEVALARRFAESGMAVAVMSYRLSAGTWMDPQLSEGVTHPAHIQDVARAFAWVHHYAADYGLDPESVFVGGYSAGAHLSALLVMDPRWLATEGLAPSDVRGAIPIAGAYDLDHYYASHLERNGQEMADNHVKGVFGYGETDLRDASPSTYLGTTRVPMLIVSETDTYAYTRVFEDAAKAAKVDNYTFVHIRGKNHQQLYRSLCSEVDAVREQILEYIRAEVSRDS